MNALDVFAERGFLKDVSNLEGLRAALESPCTVYCGYDATAPSLTIGNQVTLMMLAWLQRCGHRPIALMGGGTTMVGDPSGRTKERPLLRPEDIEANLARLRPQVTPFVDLERGGMLLDNSAWLIPLRLIDFLRDIGSRFNVHQMLSFETYRTRLEHGLTFLEFSYQLLQAYDFLQLHRDYGCLLQVGGSDQWPNILAGVDLIRKVDGAEAYALVAPLITLPGGAKISKSEAGAVFLSPELTTPYDYYQYWINAPDAEVESLLAIFTFLPMDEVRRLGRRQGADLREPKEVLAYEVTAIVHGEQAAEAARRASRALFAGDSDGPVDVPSVTIPEERFASGVPIVDLIAEVGLVAGGSKREARRQIEQGGISLNGEQVASLDRVVGTADLGDDKALLLRLGKKRYLKVRAG
ncbi:MAG TPA: tyrosine--tRNA ligase [Chloroflexota bacterium]|nr:tyrosine--tRNA ligase [Chloroflexota bacterium]